MQENSVQYKGIDVCKIIMALFIVVLHTHPFYGVNDTINFLTADVLGRIAVPFFFTATGFLLEKQVNRKKELKKEVLGRYIVKVLKMYCTWTVVYLPIIMWDRFIDNSDSLAKGVLTIIRDFIFAGSYSHLWYLPATAVAVVIVFSLRKYFGECKTAVFLLLLFIMGLLTQSYFGILTQLLEVDGLGFKIMKAVKKVMVTCRNGIFFGSIFIYMGTVTAGLQTKRKMMSAIAGFLISVVLLFTEASVLQAMGFVREQDMYFMLLPAAFFLILLALQLDIKTDTKYLRDMGIRIYLVHNIFKFVYRKFLGEYNENGPWLFLFTMGGTFVTAYLMCEISRRKRTKRIEVENAE